MAKLEPAYSVIRKFDRPDKRGEAILGTRLGVARTTVLKWTLAREKGGTGGYVPPMYYEGILAFADTLGVQLEPGEFVRKLSCSVIGVGAHQALF